MAKWLWGIAILLIMIFVSGGVYGWLNYQNWTRAKAKIEQLPEEKQAEVWREFEGYNPMRMYGGILAGTTFNRVWVWTRQGLKSFATDEHSVYSWFDGCNEEVLKELNAGVAGAIGRHLTTDIKDWGKKAKMGDYVRVFTADAEMGGKRGDLREIYTYNFWLFLPAGMEERCAK